MEHMARIVLALEGHEVAEEVMHFLDRTGHTRVVATAADERQLAEAVRQLEPDAVVASPGLLRAVVDANGSALIAVDTSESVESLRAALRAGAGGYFLWPADREELAEAASRLLLQRESVAGKRGMVVAVYGARGGAGATFVATHVTLAFTRLGKDCVLIDMDRQFADVTSALGVASEAEVRTVADVRPVVEELSAPHLEGILWRHPAGFRVLLGPSDPHTAEQVSASEYRAAIEVVRSMTDVTVLHVPRSLDDAARAGLESADRVLVVLSLDVLSFRDAKRALSSLPEGCVERCEFVVNRPARAAITPADVERVFGRRPLAVLPVDRSASAAQDHGRLLPGRGRTGRALDRLARRVVGETQ